MPNEPLISVLIPVYNAEKFLQDSVQSILDQRYENLEILICDDASSDNSKEIINTFSDSRILKFFNEKNQGYLKTINKLFELANGDFFAFQDADDISHPDRFKVQVDFLTKTGFDLVGTNYIIIDQNGFNVGQIIEPVLDNDKIKEKLIEGNVFQKPSILFKRDAYKHVGGFREGFLLFGNISEDYDWLLRVQEEGYIMSNVSYHQPLYKYRSVPTAMTKSVYDIKQLFGERLAREFAYERRAGKTDALDRGDYDRINSFINELSIPYKNDPSKFYSERAAHLMYAGLNRQAIFFAWKAFLLKPFYFNNLRTLQYCVRKTLFY